MRTLVLLYLFVSLLFSGDGFSQVSPDSLKSYTDSLNKFRTGKNIKLMYTESSPIKPEQRESFEGLKYFDPDIKFLIIAKLEKEEAQETVVMRTSTERAPEYIKYGKVSFIMDGKEMSLFAYQSKKLAEVSKENDQLFIPFRDETSGKESYGGGRYVDCTIPLEGDELLLDFNKAYNPYCAYNPRYSCVIPPEENRLDVSIKAGEKIYEPHHD